MASFNLGRIKGDKGDPGAKGDTGAKGEKGDKGDRGQPGADGLTPVFSVGKTQTVAAGGEAYVEINTEDPANPVLNFHIPRGSDGKDASGDMNASIYDTGGKGQDIFLYADSLTAACVKRDGDKMLGMLKGAECNPEESCMRNISYRTSFPENAANGDLCIITRDENAKKLGECTVGDTMLIDEAGKETAYIIVAKDYHGEDTVTLLRKDLAPYKECFDAKNRGRYLMSDIDTLLETTYRYVFSERIQKELQLVEIEDSFRRHCFLLSHEELQKMEYFGEEGDRCACRNGTNGKDTYITRSLTTAKTVYTVTGTGAFSAYSQSAVAHIRPAIVLPADLILENTEYNLAPAVALPETGYGIYVYINGEWKECSVL